LAGSNDAHLAEANMPRWRRVSSVTLSNNDHINSTSQCRGVDFIVETSHVREQFADNVHGGASLFPTTLYCNEMVFQAAKKHHRTPTSIIIWLWNGNQNWALQWQSICNKHWHTKYNTLLIKSSEVQQSMLPNVKILFHSVFLNFNYMPDKFSENNYVLLKHEMSFVNINIF